MTLITLRKPLLSPGCDGVSLVMQPSPGTALVGARPEPVDLAVAIWRRESTILKDMAQEMGRPLDNVAPERIGRCPSAGRRAGFRNSRALERFDAPGSPDLR